MTKLKYLMALLLMIFVLKSAYNQRYIASIADSVTVIDAFINEIKEGGKFKKHECRYAIPRSVRRKLKSISKHFAFSSFSKISCIINNAVLDFKYYREFDHNCRGLNSVLKSRNIIVINYYNQGMRFKRKISRILICTYNRYEVIVLPMAIRPGNIDDLYQQIIAKDFGIATFF